jgi:hypothetical protein
MMIKLLEPIKNYIKTIVQCTIKVKVGMDKRSKDDPVYGSEMLTCGGMVKEL